MICHCLTFPMWFSMGQQNETMELLLISNSSMNEILEAYVGTLETETKVVAKLLLVKLSCMPNTI